MKISESELVSYRIKDDKIIQRLLEKSNILLEDIQKKQPQESIKGELERLISAVGGIKQTDNSGMIVILKTINESLYNIQMQLKPKKTTFSVKRDYRGYIEEIIANG